MTSPRHIAVIDIGKTNAKLALVDLDTLSEVAVLTRPNVVRPGPPWPHFDTERHWAFLLDALGTFQRDHGVDGISITTHGASVVLLDQDGALAAPILDYEHPIPKTIEAQYNAIRPEFTVTGSPRLTGGLNAGAQLHYQFTTDPGLHARTAHIIGYPQYWGHRLTGKLANDVTSIGCHTDLWEPYSARLSSLVDSLNIRDKIATVRKSNDVLGNLTPQIAHLTGLSPDTPVVCGIHDSNASLYPHLLSQKGAFSVVSTGTWVVVMSIRGKDVTMDATRDTLINVNANGGSVPSARFMGGREFEVIMDGHDFAFEATDAHNVLEQDLMLLPAVAPDTGPFQGQQMAWHGAPPPYGSGLRAVALSYYLGMMTDTCLRLTGAQGPTIVEGPFSTNPHFLNMLRAATDRPVLHSPSVTGTSIGAALLIGQSGGLQPPPEFKPDGDLVPLAAYAKDWRRRASTM